MQTMQGSTLQSLVAVQTFLDANANLLGTVVTSGARKKLDDLVLQLSGLRRCRQAVPLRRRARRRSTSCSDRRSCAITWRPSRESAPPFTDVFVGAGLPADFIAQLTAASDAVVKSVRDRLQTKGVRRGATNGLKTTLSDGRKIVHVLDAFVKTALKDDPTLLANWNVVKRVQRVGRLGATPTPSPRPAPTPAPTATAVRTPSAAA